MIKTDKIFDYKSISYKLLSDGYEIYLDGNIWVRQRERYGKPIDSTLSYEKNCLAQIEELAAPEEPIENIPDRNPYGIPEGLVEQIKNDAITEIQQEVTNHVNE